MQRRNGFTLAIAFGALAVFAACSGGGNGGGSGGPPQMMTPPPGTPPPAGTQVISIALPSSAIGQENDPRFGLIGGYTQTLYSQVMAFTPGTKVMLRNGQSGIPHTLGDIGMKSFPAGQPSTLSTTPTGSSTFSAGWQSGTIAPGALVGPITLTAGTYYIGCAYHYQSNTMRDVLIVAAAATPGPQATLNPANPAPTQDPGGGYGY